MYIYIYTYIHTCIYTSPLVCLPTQRQVPVGSPASPAEQIMEKENIS